MSNNSSRNLSQEVWTDKFGPGWKGEQDLSDRIKYNLDTVAGIYKRHFTIFGHRPMNSQKLIFQHYYVSNSWKNKVNCAAGQNSSKNAVKTTNIYHYPIKLWVPVSPQILHIAPYRVVFSPYSGHSWRAHNQLLVNKSRRWTRFKKIKPQFLGSHEITWSNLWTLFKRKWNIKTFAY